MSKTDCLTRSVTGRVVCSVGASNFRPRELAGDDAHAAKSSGASARPDRMPPWPVVCATSVRGFAVGISRCRSTILIVNAIMTIFAWYLLHDKVVIFVEDAQWYIGILTRCKALQPDNRCGIYDTRPAICRSYSTDNCDYHAGDYGYDLLFTSPDALWDLRGEKACARTRPRVRKKKPKKKRSRATRARELSQTLGIPPEITAGADASSGGGGDGKSGGNGRSVPLKIFGR